MTKSLTDRQVVRVRHAYEFGGGRQEAVDLVHRFTASGDRSLSERLVDDLSRSWRPRPEVYDEYLVRVDGRWRVLRQFEYSVLGRGWGDPDTTAMACLLDEAEEVRPLPDADRDRDVLTALQIARNYLLGDDDKPRDQYAADDLEIVDAAIESVLSPGDAARGVIRRD